jgi:hypothetical protein
VQGSSFAPQEVPNDRQPASARRGDRRVVRASAHVLRELAHDGHDPLLAARCLEPMQALADEVRGSARARA